VKRLYLRAVLALLRSARFCAGANTGIVFLVLTCFGLACLYAHMMRSVLAALPFYDEMWKLDVITAPSILARIQTLPTPLAPGWAWLTWLLLRLIGGEPVLVARCLSAIWILPAILLLQGSLAAAEESKKQRVMLLCGAAFIGFCRPMQSALSYLNPYVFEVCSSVAIVVLSARWTSLGAKGRTATLVLLAATPVFSFSPMFFLPAAYATLLLRSPNGRWRLAAGLSLFACVALAAVLVLRVYGTTKAPNLSALQDFWGADMVQHSPATLLRVLRNFPIELSKSLLPVQLVPVADKAASALAAVVFGFALLGIFVLWQTSRHWTVCLFSASAIACVAAYLQPWPLAFAIPLNRINLAPLWPWYFAFAIGVARLIEPLFGRLRRFPILPFLAVIAALSPSFTPYPPPDDPDREIFTAIRDHMANNGAGKNLVIPLHYSTVPYANYLLVNRLPDHFKVIDISPRTPAFQRLKELPLIVSQNSPTDAVWIIIPHFFRSETMKSDLDNLVLTGFQLHQTFSSSGCDIREYLPGGGSASRVPPAA